MVPMLGVCNSQSGSGSDSGCLAADLIHGGKAHTCAESSCSPRGRIDVRVDQPGCFLHTGGWNVW